MGVSRNLKVDAVGARFIELHRLVCEEDDGLARISPLHGAFHICAVAVAEPVGRPIVDASDVDHFSVLGQLHAFVAKGPNADPPQKREPRVRSRVVLVITGDEVRAETCLNLPEWRYGMPEVFDRTVDEVARDRYDVGLERVDLADDVFDEIASYREAHVHVGDLH